MNISDEDFAVASLAKLVGNELHTIDKFTTQSTNGPANKLDPRNFITGRAAAQDRAMSRGGQRIVNHNGQAFYAGVDEALVASLHPDPPSMMVPQESVTTKPPELGRAVVQQNKNVEVQIKPSPIINTEISDTLIKTLKSIDKTLKLIAKNLQPESK